MTDEQAKELSEANAHIPTEEIQEDIIKTQIEMLELTRRERGFRMLGDRMSIIKANGCAHDMEERENFIGQLQEILTYRKTHS
jgi:hypothetical protein